MSDKHRFEGIRAPDGVPEEPDEKTQLELKKEETAQRKVKSRTAGVRADDLEAELIAELRRELEREVARNDRAEKELAELRAAKVELAKLRAPRELRRCLAGMAAALGAFGTWLVAAYPEDAESGVLALSASTTHAVGVALLLVAALGALSLAVKP